MLSPASNASPNQPEHAALSRSPAISSTGRRARAAGARAASARTSNHRGGCPLYPRGRRCSPRLATITSPRPPHLSGASLRARRRFRRFRRDRVRRDRVRRELGLVGGAATRLGRRTGVVVRLRLPRPACGQTGQVSAKPLAWPHVAPGAAARACAGPDAAGEPAVEGARVAPVAALAFAIGGDRFVRVVVRDGFFRRCWLVGVRRGARCRLWQAAWVIRVLGSGHWTISTHPPKLELTSL
jgi:hypothetical protein